jgi:hypothetical protein
MVKSPVLGQLSEGRVVVDWLIFDQFGEVDPKNWTTGRGGIC